MRTIQKALQGFWLPDSSYQGIILGLPKYAGKTGFEKFFGMVSSMVASFGHTLRLPSGDVLILFSPEDSSPSRDRDLLTHRLVKTLRTRALAGFHAESPEEVLSRIREVSSMRPASGT
jgi:hypothetical protein